jgi:propionyl-CoA carboxylase beta chain
VNIIFKDQIESSSDPVATRKRLEAEYIEKFANPYVPAGRGFIDDIIEPKQTRPKLISALQMLKNKRDSNPPKKHGNIPL